MELSKDIKPETEDLILASRIFILEKLIDDLLGALNIKKFDEGDKDIDNYKVRVGNILFVMNSMINKLSEQRDRLSENGYLQQKGTKE